MENFPYHIENENDLDFFESYLQNENQGMMMQKPDNMSYIPQDNQRLPKSLKNTAYLPAFLSKHIGKLVKIESLIGGKLESRVGILLTVGANFIVLRQIRSNNTMICELSLIKYATVIHDNDYKKLMP